MESTTPSLENLQSTSGDGNMVTSESPSEPLSRFNRLPLELHTLIVTETLELLPDGHLGPELHVRNSTNRDNWVRVPILRLGMTCRYLHSLCSQVLLETAEFSLVGADFANLIPDSAGSSGRTNEYYDLCVQFPCYGSQSVYTPPRYKRVQLYQDSQQRTHVLTPPLGIQHNIQRISVNPVLFKYLDGEAHPVLRSIKHVTFVYNEFQSAGTMFAWLTVETGEDGEWKVIPEVGRNEKECALLVALFPCLKTIRLVRNLVQDTAKALSLWDCAVSRREVLRASRADARLRVAAGLKRGIITFREKQDAMNEDRLRTIRRDLAIYDAEMERYFMDLIRKR